MAGETINCSSACTVTIALEPAPVDPARLTDLTDAWGLFLGAAIVIILLKKMYDIFDKAPHGD